MEIAGYFAAVLIGLTLGLMGAGGSILTVPVLVYLFGFNPVTATSYSLFIVGVTAFTGSISYFRQGEIKFRTTLLFVLPSLLSVYLTRSFLIPALPEVILSSDLFTLTKGGLILIFFSVLMIFSSLSMIRSGKNEKESPVKEAQFHGALILLIGFGTGIVTGFAGAGGGFIIIPVLVLLAGLPIRSAIGTSLVIITMNSLMGFSGDLLHSTPDWTFLIPFSLIPVAAIFPGTLLSRKIDPAKLKLYFGWFVLIIGIVMLVKELMA
ncbi:MAG: sulfite exporter TauE/SafE family protein [Bacteroidetes bacterium]|nr:sulfite exporter TauE/SafE family protein [Bacteroidota bacterium]